MHGPGGRQRFGGSRNGLSFASSEWWRRRYDYRKFANIGADPDGWHARDTLVAWTVDYGHPAALPARRASRHLSRALEGASAPRGTASRRTRSFRDRGRRFIGAPAVLDGGHDAIQRFPMGPRDLSLTHRLSALPGHATDKGKANGRELFRDQGLASGVESSE